MIAKTCGKSKHLSRKNYNTGFIAVFYFFEVRSSKILECNFPKP
jgi:hypothetical protein